MAPPGGFDTMVEIPVQHKVEDLRDGAKVVVHPYSYDTYRVTIVPVDKPTIIYVHPHTLVQREVIFKELIPMWTPYLSTYAHQTVKVVILEWVTQDSFGDDIASTFYEVDKDGNNLLEWNNGEIRSFITKLYEKKGLPVPDEATMFNMYRHFDEDKNGGLDAVEAQNMAHAHVSSLCHALSI